MRQHVRDKIPQSATRRLAAIRHVLRCSQRYHGGRESSIVLPDSRFTHSGALAS